MTRDAIIARPGVAVRGIADVSGRNPVALPAQLLARLFEEPVIVTAVGTMALGAASPLNGIGVDGVMLESERPGLFGMADAAYPLPFIGKIVIGPLGEPVAAQTGDGILKDGMVGTEHQAGHLVSMAGDTKAGVIA